MTLYILNILDLFFTIHAISHGGVELNPFMRNIPFMIFYKTVIIGALIWWVNKRISLKPITAVFVAVNLWHLYNLALVWA